MTPPVAGFFMRLQNLSIADNSHPAIMVPMDDFRKIISARMEELGWQPFHLAHACMARGAGRDSVYRFLAGKRDVTSDTLQTMFEVLNLKVSKGPKPKKLPTRVRL